MPSRPKAPETPASFATHRPDGVPLEYEIPGRRPEPETPYEPWLRHVIRRRPESEPPDEAITETSGADAVIEQES